jgi:hypothetical protein
MAFMHHMIYFLLIALPTTSAVSTASLHKLEAYHQTLLHITVLILMIFTPSHNSIHFTIPGNK